MAPHLSTRLPKYLLLHSEEMLKTLPKRSLGSQIAKVALGSLKGSKATSPPPPPHFYDDLVICIFECILSVL